MKPPDYCEQIRLAGVPVVIRTMQPEDRASEEAFVRNLSASLEEDFAHSREVPSPATDSRPGWLARSRRAVVSWLARTYLRLAGVTRRY